MADRVVLPLVGGAPVQVVVVLGSVVVVVSCLLPKKKRSRSGFINVKLRGSLPAPTEPTPPLRFGREARLRA